MNGEIEFPEFPETQAECDVRLWLATEQLTNDVALHRAAYELGEPTMLDVDGNCYRALASLSRDDLERIIMLLVVDGGESTRRAQAIVTDARSTGAMSV